MQMLLPEKAVKDEMLKSPDDSPNQSEHCREMSPSHGPARRPRLLLMVLLLLVSFAVLVSEFSYYFYPARYDEPYLGWAAQQAAEGRIPYRDFQVMVPPLSVYIPAAWTELSGPGLGRLRILSILWLSGLTLMLFLILVSEGVPDLWAAGAAIIVPCSIVLYWPITSHHWFASGAGLLALWGAFRAERIPVGKRWFLAGVLACVTALFLQTDGFVILLVVLALLFLETPRGKRRKMGLAFSAGYLLPAAATGFVLLLQGALVPAIDNLIVWPMTYYKRTGTFNDVNLLQTVAAVCRDGMEKAHSVMGALSFMNLLGTLLVPVAIVLFLAFSPHLFRPGSAGKRTWLWCVLSVTVVLFAYSRGRTDLVRLMLFFPLLMVIAAKELAWDTERVRPALVKAWILAMVIFSTVHWTTYWIQHPPLVRQVLQEDAYRREYTLAAILRMFPRIVKERASVISIPHGSPLYLYYAPDPPPVDWISPPRDYPKAGLGYKELTAFISTHKPAFIFIEQDHLTGADYVKEFLTFPSPIKTLLESQYRPFKSTPWGYLFKRVSGAQAQTAGKKGGN